MPRRWTAFLALLALLAACARAPYTGRRQLVLVSERQAIELGARAFREVVAQSEVVTDPAFTTPVGTVGRRIAEVAEQPDYEWRFVVLDEPKMPNAFALPGGRVGIYTGIFPIAETTHGLAVVMAHEVAHVVAHHGTERLSQGMVAQLGGTVLGAVLGTGPSTQAILVAYGLGAQVGVLLPYGRAQESEADHIGLLMMARAGFDPRSALGFWERMERTAEGAAQPPEFLSTHPSHGTRMANIRRWMPEALRHYEAARPVPVETLPAVGE